MCRCKTFCFRFSIRSGAITAAVHTALGLVSLLGYSGCILFLAEYYDEYPTQYRFEDEDTAPASEGVLILRISGIIFLAITLIKLIVLIIFCVGINKNRARLVLVWLVWTAIEIILLPILIIVAALFAHDLLFLLGLIYVVFMLYLYFFTLSYYLDLVDGVIRPSPL